MDSDDLIKLFTALYRVFTVPTKFSEVCVMCNIVVCVIREFYDVGGWVLQRDG